MFGRVVRATSRRRWCPCAVAGIAIVLTCPVARAQFPDQFFEGSWFPEEFCWSDCWDVLPDGPVEGERWVEEGWFVQAVQEGDQSYYRMELDQFVGVDGFFVEWRAITDNPAWLIEQGQVPTVVAAAGKAESWYHTTFAESAAALFRDPRFGTLMVSVSVGLPHVYRVEVFTDLYLWYIDGVLIDSGAPEGPYPDANGFLIWGAEVSYDGAPTAMVAWDYVRAGEMPLDGSGDYDVSGYQDTIDYFFFHDCLTKDGPGIYGGPGEPGHSAGPGCRALDMDFDGDVDLRDFAQFQALFEDYPCEPFCDVPCSICFSPPRTP